MNLLKKIIFIISICLVLVSCKNDTKTIPAPEKKPSTFLAKAPVFSEQNAFELIEKQLSFGPRNPNSIGHEEMAKWMIEELKQLADTVYVQKADLKAFDGNILKSTNVIASFNPKNKNRMLLAAHWDTRPFADHDDEKTNEPILGANDGASGVAIMMEIAYLLKVNGVSKGIDLIFFDSEDYGQPTNSKFPLMQDSYCLGSQYWSKNPHVDNYYASFGILLDMVGGRNVKFFQEEYSLIYANSYVQKVWSYAKVLGYSSYFKNQRIGKITDDHLYINKNINIPTLDIIEYDLKNEKGFGDYWHTHDDNIEAIDKNTLKAVGQTVTQVVYQFNNGNF